MFIYFYLVWGRMSDPILSDPVFFFFFFSISHCYSFVFRPVRVYKNVPWMPEHTVVPPSSQGSFPVSQQIIVGNLPSDTNEEDLRKFFESKYHLLDTLFEF